MNVVERPALSGNEYTDYLVMPWVEYANYLEERIAELEWMREGLEK